MRNASPVNKSSLLRAVESSRSTVRALREFRRQHTPCNGCELCRELPAVLWSAETNRQALDDLLDQCLADLQPRRRAS